MMKTTIILLTLTFILTATAVVMAQPPGLPGTPSQAPIDGGLGILVAAGGAYALKKLKNRQNDDLPDSEL